MIRVNIEQQSSDESILSFSVDGHANYDESGKDIVCAGVSAVTVGTINAAEALLDVKMDVMMEHGLLKAVVPNHLDDSIYAQLQLQLKSMIVMLQSIEQSYGQYMSMTYQKRR